MLHDIDNEGKRRAVNQAGLHGTSSFHRCSTYSVSDRGHCHPPLRGGGLKGGMK